MAYPNSQGTIELENLDPKTYRAPASRIVDANAAQDIVLELWRDYNRGIGEVNAIVKGCLDGNPPVAQNKLDEIGQGWRANLNFRLLEADIAFASVPYYSVFSEVPYYAEVKLEVSAGSPEQRKRWEDTISAEHYRLMNKWKGFDYQMQLSIAQRVTFGCGPIYYPDDCDFRFAAARNGEVFVPARSSCDTTKLPLAVLTEVVDVVALYDSIERQSAEDAGWRTEAVKKAIVECCNGNVDIKDRQNWDYWQTQIRHNQWYYSTVAPAVKLAHVFVKEFSGSISHYIVVAFNGLGEYLFQHRDRFSCWNSVLHFFNGEIGDGYLQGVKGLGIKCFNIRDTQNRLKNHTIDAAFTGAQVLLQATTPEGTEALDIIQMGPYALIPSNVGPFEQKAQGSVVDKPLAVDRQLETDLIRNIGGYRQNLTDSRGQAVTATEAQLNYGQQQSISQQQHNLFVGQLDDLYEEQMDRLTKDLTEYGPASDDDPEWLTLTRDFQQRCVKQGVPRKAFKKIDSVRAYRSLGQGSKFFRNQINEKLLGIFPLLPEAVRTRHLRNYIGGLASPDYLRDIWPAEEMANIPTDDASKAQDENGIMTIGLVAIWSPNQNNLVHARTHIGFEIELFTAVQKQQADPIKFISFHRTAEPHIKLTLQKLMQDAATPGALDAIVATGAEERKQLFDAYEQLSSAADKMEQELQAQAQAQQQQAAQAAQAQAQQGPPVDPKLALEAAKAQQEMQIKAAESQQDMQIKAVQAQQELAINDAAAASKKKRGGSKK